jgi:hypothetical protein
LQAQFATAGAWLAITKRQIKTARKTIRRMPLEKGRLPTAYCEYEVVAVPIGFLKVQMSKRSLPSFQV